MRAMDARAIAEWFRLFEWSPTDPAWPQRQKSIWAWRKFRKARRWTRVLARIPFVRMVAIGNALGYGNCTEESDVDFVIVVAPRRVWMVRLLVVGLLRLFRQRPGERSQDAICPSFFLTTEAVAVESLQLQADQRTIEHENHRTQEDSFSDHVLQSCSPTVLQSPLPPDPYLLFWSTQLTVLYDVGDTYGRFWRANERWVRRWLPDVRPRAVHPRLAIVRRQQPAITIGMERFLSGRLGDALECRCRRFQERRFSADVRALANRDSRVIITDRMLKFHTNDRRAEYRDRWLAALGIL